MTSPYPPPPGQPAPDHPQATTALVLGILGILLCGVLAPFAWVIGGKAVREIDESGGTVGGRGTANAGKILGIVGTILLVLAAIVLVVVFVGVLGVVSSIDSEVQTTLG